MSSEDDEYNDYQSNIEEDNLADQWRNYTNAKRDKLENDFEEYKKYLLKIRDKAIRFQKLTGQKLCINCPLNKYSDVPLGDLKWRASKKRSLSSITDRTAEIYEYLNKFYCEPEDPVLSTIFNGVCIFVNGYTNPVASILHTIMVFTGGTYTLMYDTFRTTHTIAAVLSSSQIKSDRVKKSTIKPEWIIESLHARKQLPLSEYLVFKQKNQIKEMFEKIENKKNAKMIVEKIPTILSENVQLAKISMAEEEFKFKLIAENFRLAQNANLKIIIENNSPELNTIFRFDDEVLSNKTTQNYNFNLEQELDDLLNNSKDAHIKLKVDSKMNSQIGTLNLMAIDNNVTSISEQMSMAKLDKLNEHTDKSISPSKNNKRKRDFSNTLQDNKQLRIDFMFRKEMIRNVDPKHQAMDIYFGKRGPNKPNICGKVKIEHVCSLIKEWITSGDKLTDFDITYVLKYLYGLIDRKHYEELKTILVKMKEYIVSLPYHRQQQWRIMFGETFGVLVREENTIPNYLLPDDLFNFS